MNKQDPITQTPPRGRELFEAMSRICDGASSSDVMSAALNMLLSGLRQSYPARAGAFTRLDQLFSESRRLLDGCYDNAGKRRNIYPFDQTITPKLFNAADGRRFHGQ